MTEAIEDACRAWYNAGLLPRQYDWDQMVKLDDHRLTGWREQMRAALNAVGFLELNAIRVPKRRLK